MTAASFVPREAGNAERAVLARCGVVAGFALVASIIDRGVARRLVHAEDGAGIEHVLPRGR